MWPKNLKNKKGFTLIEIIVVLTILAVLAAFSIPTYLAYVKNSKMMMDESTVGFLNRITQASRMSNPNNDPFIDETKSSEDLRQVLVDRDYLSPPVEPKTKDAEFAWDFEKSKWYLKFGNSSYVVTLSDGLKFRDKDDLGRLEGPYSGTAKDILIPISIDGIDIKEIYQDAFANKGLIAVNFDENSKIVQIHARAFQDNNLKSIDLPDSLTKIDLRSFKDNQLTEIKLPPNLQRIQQKAFEGNPLTKIEISGNISADNIGVDAFGDQTEQFKTAYTEGGAGTYILNGDTWVRQ